MATVRRGLRDRRAGGSGGIVALLVVVVAIAAGFAYYVARTRSLVPGSGDGLPVLGQVPPFELIDQDGRPFSSRSLAGKVWVGNFMFTRCSFTCPVQAKKFSGLEAIIQSVPGLSGEVRLVSFSVDSERDGPADLEAYARDQEADPELRIFLTGPPGAVARLSEEGFQLAAGAAAGTGEGGAPALTHSDRFLLVDREGRLRGRYRPTVDGEDEARLERDLRRLAGK
jgi:protein SCO1/2